MSLKKQIASAIATLALGAALIGGGTFAYFNDTATSAGNTFATGTIDIHSKLAPVPFAVTNAKPGTLFNAEFTVQNTGTLDANASFKFDYTNTDGATPADGSDLGKILQITSFQYGGVNIAIADTNGNLYTDLNDIKAQVFQLGQVNANTIDANAKKVTIAGVFRETNVSQNEFQGDALNGTFTFEAMQQ